MLVNSPQVAASPEGAGQGERDKYIAEVTALHAMLVHAMKAKQTTDETHVSALRELIESFRGSYLGEAAKGR